jgi:hypothetical protein
MRTCNFDSRIEFVAMGSDLSDSELQRLRELRAQAFARIATIEAQLDDVIVGIEGDEPQLREVEGDEPQLREVEGDEPEMLEVEGEVEGDKPDVPEVEGEVETPQLREGLDGDQCDFVALTPQSKVNLMISSLEAGTELNFKISTCRLTGGKWILAGRINGRFICGMHLEHMTILGPGQQIRLIGEDDAAAAAAGVDQATTQEDDEEEDEEETEDTSRGLTELNGVSFDAVGESEPRRRRLNEQLDAF